MLGRPAILAAGLLAAQSTIAIDLNLNDAGSIKSAASTIAYKMMTFYPGNKTGGIPGLLGDPYYWWEAGGMFGTLIDYWYYTGDASYNNVTSEAMLFQTGQFNDYMPANQSKDLGNDDQSYWGFAAMSAAEANFANPPPKDPQWLALAQAVFNSQALRWDTATCGGGLKWQIFVFNNGYNYKNSPSNGCFFTLGARLYAYTGNTTYADWANKAWDWSTAIGLVSDKYDVWDGTEDTLNCTQMNNIQWTYNFAVYMYGTAVMWNMTQQDVWKQRTQSLWQAANIFFTGTNNQVMYEVACEPNAKCDTDQLSFKAYTSRWMAATMKVAPFIADSIRPFLATSATAAAQSCVGGDDKMTCGTKWNVAGWDGATGVGQQMSALQVIQSNLIDSVRGPVSNSTGGTSVGDPSAGTGSGSVSGTVQPRPITAADRAGAGIITAMLLTALLGGAWFMIT